MVKLTSSPKGEGIKGKGTLTGELKIMDKIAKGELNSYQKISFAPCFLKHLFKTTAELIKHRQRG